MKLRIGILLTLTSLLSAAQAQQYEFALSGGTTGYMGDLNTYHPFYFKKAGGGLSAKYNLNSTLGFELGYNYLSIAAADRDFDRPVQQRRDLSFRNNISELSLTGVFNFYRFIPGKQLNIYTPYITAGVAGILHDPYVMHQNHKIHLRKLFLELDEEGKSYTYNRFAIAIPVGVGVKYNIKGPWTIAADVSYRTVLSDNIDNVSQYYNSPTPIDQFLPNFDLVENGEKRPFTQADWNQLADPSGKLAENAGTSRGDGHKFDGYMTAGFKLTYTIISKKCYWWQ